MQRNFTNDDFERFLKRSADGLRMRPSEDVWKAISQNLGKRKRRITYFGLSLLAVSSVITFLLVNNPKPVLHPLNTSIESITNSKIQSSSLPLATNSTTNTNNTIGTVATYNEPTSDVLPSQTSSITAGRITSPVSMLAVDQQSSGTTKSSDLVSTTIPLLTNQEEFIGTIVDSDPVPADATATTKKSTVVDPADKLLSIESVTNSFRGYKKNKLSFQAFFTPTVSYRKLSENKSYLRSANQLGAPPQLAALYNINDLVTHKPNIGLELGFTAKYAIAKSIKVKGGVQFNMSRYDIKAFNYTAENATIALNNGGNNVDYLEQETTYRRVGTNSAVNWLENLYFQVSAPVGLEVKIHGTKNAKFGIASTIQPTYIMSDRAYLLSYDYKNYTEVPWLIRKWNVNTALETFVSYSTGKMQWQVGPQVRYQLLSSFVDEYPVKENLFDFGLKVGVSLNNNSKTEINK